MNNIYEAIKRLPDDPDMNVIWVTYNEDMKKTAIQLISLLKGERYMDRCRVVSRDNFEVPVVGSHLIYYSPDLLDHMGNGAN